MDTLSHTELAPDLLVKMMESSDGVHADLGLSEVYVLRDRTTGAKSVVVGSGSKFYLLDDTTGFF